MYRPKKRKLVRRVSAASAVAVVTAAGLGVTFMVQSGATTTAVGTTKNTAAATTTAKTTTPTYHIVGLKHHDDSRSSGDN
jgi:hypothetical protein